MFETIQFDLRDDGVAILTIDVPGSNANVMGDQFTADLSAVIDKVVADDTIRAAVFASAKNDFMAGGDLKAMVDMFSVNMTPAQALAVANSVKPHLRKLETCGKPFVAAIAGAAMGGGLELALACHGRVVADNPKIPMALPEVTLGLLPGAGGTQRLPRMIGARKALELMLTGKPLDPAGALALGLVDAVVPAAQLLDQACALALRVSPVKPWDSKGFTVPGGSSFFDADLGNFYNFMATSIAKDTQRNLPAPIGTLRAVARGLDLPIDQGLHIESCEFAKLVLDPTARNMVRALFVSKGELDKLVNRPQGIAKAHITRIGVIGGGLMGGGIAQTAAKAGIDVVLIDISQENADKGKTAIAAGLGKLVAKGRMTQDKLDALLARITATADYSQLADCQLVIEAVFEDVGIKQKVFTMARAAMHPDAILASNTSTLPINDLCEGIPHPDRFIGLHFFSPVDRMPLVEVIVGQQTTAKTLAESLDLIAMLRKTPIIVNDSRGFFTSRVISAYLQEAFSMVADGLSPTLIDNVAKQAGFAIGPLALIDDIGMENGYKATLSEQAAVGASWKEPAGFAVQKIFHDDLKRIGRRCGAGFYDYVDNQRQPWAGLSDVFTPAAVTPAISTLKQRLLYIQCLEAARIMEEGVITSPAEADVGVILGLGFPTYTGGVFSLIDSTGLQAFVDACDQLADSVGERFRPSAWLRQRAASGQTFYGTER